MSSFHPFIYTLFHMLWKHHFAYLKWSFHCYCKIVFSPGISALTDKNLIAYPALFSRLLGVQFFPNHLGGNLFCFFWTKVRCDNRKNRLLTCKWCPLSSHLHHYTSSKVSSETSRTVAKELVPTLPERGSIIPLRGRVSIFLSFLSNHSERNSGERRQLAWDNHLRKNSHK